MSVRIITAIVVVAGAVIALIAGAVPGGAHHQAVEDGSRPAQLPVAPTRPPGSVIYGRSLGTGPFGDETQGLVGASLAGPDRVVILRRTPTCCLAWASASHAFAATISGPRGPLLGVGSIGVGSYRRMAYAGQSLGLLAGAWSPDGSQLAVTRLHSTSSEPAGVYVGGGQDTIRLAVRTPPGRVDRVLSMSPDGSRLLILRLGAHHDSNRAGVLYTLRLGARGAGLVRLTPRGSFSWCCYFGSPATWSRDGSRVAFAAFTPGPKHDLARSAVWVARADGTAEDRISQWGAWTTSAQWSPTGGWIVFDRVNQGRTGYHDLFVIRPDGSGEHVVATGTGGGGSCCAQWSSDGRYLIYERAQDDQHVALHMVAVDGRSAPVRLTGDAGSYFSFAVGS